VKLSRVEIQAFGCLSNFNEDIAPALHVFHGPNESGKSTLQQVVLALLYGFYEGDRAKAAENAARQRFVPWQNPRYTARLEYDLQDGGRFRVTRDFADDDNPTTVSDMVTGRPITDEFGRGRHGNVPFMRKQLGMTRRVFESCAFVSQGELLQVTGEGRVTPQEMGDAIISLADTARRDVSAQKAIERLGDAIRKQVGGRAARATPLPVARNALTAARKELEEIDRVREEIAADAETLERSKEQARSLDESITRHRYLLGRAELSELESRLNRLARLDLQAQHSQEQLDASSAFADLPVDERDDLIRAWNSIRELRERLVQEQPETERQRRRLEELNESREALSVQERDLSRLRQYPADRQPDIEALAQHWRQAETIFREAESRTAAATAAAAPLRDEYETLAGEASALSATDIHVLTDRLRAPAPSGRSLIGAILAAMAIAGRALARGVRAAGRFLLRRKVPNTDVAPSQPAASPLDSVSPVEADRLLQAHRRYLEVAPLIQKQEAEQSAAERARANRDAAATQLRHSLEGLVDDLTDLNSACGQFATRASSRKQLDTIVGKLEAVESESESLRDTVNRFIADGDRLRKLETQLTQRLSDIVKSDGKLEDLFSAFEAACAQHKAHQDAARSLREIENTRGGILEGRSPAELSEMIARRQADITQLTAANPALEGARSNANAEAIKESLAKESRDLRDLELRIESLSTRTGTRLSGLRSRAEVEEEIQQHTNEAAALEAFGSALTLAKDLVEQAMIEAHRDFAPSVGRFLSDGLAQVTDGRYQKAMLDPATFRVTTEVPETGRLVDVDVLSQGTQAAAYMLLRVGLAQHMSDLSEPVPLLLDDPLVDLDDVRIENFLDLLFKMAIERDLQILLFTKDEATRRWFERSCAGNPSCRITEFQPIAARVPVSVSPLLAHESAAAAKQARLQMNGGSGPSS
jgi:DNA repair exonuclease SbcCD ATPase subunit